MARVKQEVLAKVEDYVAGLKDDMKDKCTLCNTTLAGIVAKGEAKTQAPTKTVINELVKRFNEDKVIHDQVTVDQLHDRYRRFIMVKGPNKKPAKTKTETKTKKPGKFEKAIVSHLETLTPAQHKGFLALCHNPDKSMNKLSIDFGGNQGQIYNSARDFLLELSGDASLAEIKLPKSFLKAFPCPLTKEQIENQESDFTMKDACEFFGLSELTWISQDALDALENVITQNPMTEEMEKTLEGCLKILTTIIK